LRVRDQYLQPRLYCYLDLEGCRFEQVRQVQVAMQRQSSLLRPLLLRKSSNPLRLAR
jgi:hypothetical protein